MTKREEKFYQFKPLTNYDFKQRLVIRIAGVLIYGLIWMVGKTMRFETDAADYRSHADSKLSVPIICGWHDRLFAGAYYFRDRGLVVMSSISFDAEYTARVIQRFGFGIIKGSSTRGGARALVEMVRAMKTGIPMLFTIDGPRGPRYEAKPGPPLLAKLTGCPILPISIEAKQYFTVGSWDKAQIPFPFTRAKVFVSEPIFISPNADDAELEQKRLDLQNALDSLVEKGKAWAIAEAHA